MIHLLLLCAATQAMPVFDSVAGFDVSSSQVYAFATTSPFLPVSDLFSIMPRLGVSWLGYTSGQMELRSPGAFLTLSPRYCRGPLTVSAGAGIEARASEVTDSGQISPWTFPFGPAFAANLWWSHGRGALFAEGSYGGATKWTWSRLGGQLDVAHAGRTTFVLSTDLSLQGNADIRSVGGGLGFGLAWGRPMMSLMAHGGVAHLDYADGKTAWRPSLAGSIWGRSQPGAGRATE